MDPEAAVERLANGNGQTILAVALVAVVIFAILLYRRVQQLSDARVEDSEKRVADIEKAGDRSREDSRLTLEALNRNTNAMNSLTDVVTAMATRGAQ